MKYTLSLLALGATLASVRSASASQHTLVVDADGAGASALASSLSPGADWSSVDVSRDVKGVPPRPLTSARTKRTLVERLTVVAAARHADAALYVSQSKSAHARKVSLVLVDASGAVLVDTEVPLAAAAGRDDASKLDEALRPGLAKLAPPPAAAAPPSPVAAAASSPSSPALPDAPADADRASARQPTALPDLFALAVGGQMQSRSMTFHDPIGNPRTYDLAAAPAIGADVELYPAARSSTPVLRDLGLVGDVSYALGLSSMPASGGPAVSTSWSRFDGGVRGRARLGAAVVGLTGGVGHESFSFSSAAPDLPSVSYTYLRARLDAGVPVGPLVAVAAAGFLPVLSGGDVASRYRGTHVNAVEASLGVRAPFARHFEARLTGDYTRYFYSFSPVPGDAHVAGGALDQMLRVQVALAARY